MGGKIPPFYFFIIVLPNIISLEFLDVVSEIIMLAYKLNQNIDGEKLLKDIQKLILKNIGPDKEYLLVVKVQEINYDDNLSIPKLTYSNSNNS